MSGAREVGVGASNAAAPSAPPALAASPLLASALGLAEPARAKNALSASRARFGATSAPRRTPPSKESFAAHTLVAHGGGRRGKIAFQKKWYSKNGIRDGGVEKG